MPWSAATPHSPLGTLKIVCTEPLPKECVPNEMGRLSSCSAPATISEAEAEPPLIRTMTGRPLVMSPGQRIEVRGVIRLATAGRDDFALVEESVRTRNRLIQQAAWVITQIEDEPFELVRAELAGQITDRLFQAFGGLLGELRDVVWQHYGFCRANLSDQLKWAHICWRSLARGIIPYKSFGITAAPSKIDKSSPMVRTILMHQVAPQCAVKVAGVDGEARRSLPRLHLAQLFAGPWRRRVIPLMRAAWFVIRGSRLQSGWLWPIDRAGRLVPFRQQPLRFVEFGADPLGVPTFIRLACCLRASDSNEHSSMHFRF